LAAKKKKRRAAAEAPRDPAPELTKSTASSSELWTERARAYALLTLSAILMPLSFVGFGLWPLAFVGMIPALFVFDADPRPTGMKFLLRSLFFGTAAFSGGFYWVVITIVEFGGVPLALAGLFGSIFFVYQACQYVLMLWLWRRARDRGWNASLALVSAFVACELVFPMLFDHYYGNTFHNLTPLIQVADLGGPMLLTALAMLGNGAVYELLRARLRREPLPRVAPIAFAGLLVFYLGYGFYRIAEVEDRLASAPTLTVGIVQTNMGIDATRRDPAELHRRHIEQSLELEAEAHPDLLVWPESSVGFVPENANVRRYAFTSREGVVTTPTIFGTGTRRADPESQRGFSDYNVAFLADGDGNVLGSYDKTYLLAFGEYIPFGEQFPGLYDLSPGTGRFTPGEHVRPLRFRDYRIATLVCYEDIITRFVRRAVREGDPHLLVNISNDAWFGDTHEPWVHLALAKFRAVEHHRYLVRATLTGVSAIVDPTGRVVTQGPAYERASLHGEVAMLTGWTPYQTLGDWPGWGALALIVYLVFIGRRTPSSPKPTKDDDERDEKSPAQPPAA
jgi:apolipoprotein N-acyltransferase